MAEKWFFGFKYGHTCANDSKHANSLNSAVFLEIIKIQKIHLATCKLKICDIVDNLKTPKCHLASSLVNE